MSNESIDNLYDIYQADGDDLKKHGFVSTANEKALFTERRRKIEEKLEMLRIKSELGLEDDFAF
jgi:hypothetical protein